MNDSSLPPVRRIVTGHDANNVATVLWDSTAPNTERSPISSRTLLWSTEQMPCKIDLGESIEDEGARKLGTQPPVNGTRFTINDIAPGQTSPLHRTESLDYAVVLFGEIDMILDNDERVALHVGDVVIQRGTNHAWSNRGTTWGRLLFVLMDAVPLGIGHAVAHGASAGGER